MGWQCGAAPADSRLRHQVGHSCDPVLLRSPLAVAPFSQRHSSCKTMPRWFALVLLGILVVAEASASGAAPEGLSSCLPVPDVAMYPLCQAAANGACRPMNCTEQVGARAGCTAASSAMPWRLRAARASSKLPPARSCPPTSTAGRPGQVLSALPSADPAGQAGTAVLRHLMRVCRAGRGAHAGGGEGRRSAAGGGGQCELLRRPRWLLCTNLLEFCTCKRLRVCLRVSSCDGSEEQVGVVGALHALPPPAPTPCALPFAFPIPQDSCLESGNISGREQWLLMSLRRPKRPS